MEANRNSYLSSISQELSSLKDRVRDLIGDAHWPTDGSYRESLLRYAIKRFMPSGVAVAHGFVVDPTRSEPVSKEMDILVLDTQNEAPLFHADDIVISTADIVMAAVSVKSSLDVTTLANSVENIQSLKTIAKTRHSNLDTWTGAFFFESLESPTTLENYLRGKSGNLRTDHKFVSGTFTGHKTLPVPDLIAGPSGLVCKLGWKNPGTNADTRIQARIFDCGDLAAAVFVADLVEAIFNMRTGEQSALVRVFENQQFRVAGSFEVTPPAPTK